MTPRSLFTTALLSLSGAALLLGALPQPLEAQRPISVGTATGLGLGGMTEARFGEAVLWNPALAGIFDGPTSSISILGVSAELSGGDNLWTLGRGLYELRETEPEALAEARRALGELGTQEDASFQAGGGVQWLGVHSRDFLLSLTSYGFLQAEIPEAARAIVRRDEGAAFAELGDEEMAEAARRWSSHSLITTLAVAKGYDLGIVPVLGRAWLGAGVKASYLHDHAWGRFSYQDAESLVGETDAQEERPFGEIGTVYQSVGLSGAQIYGVDVGVVSHPAKPLLLSATLANVYQRNKLSVEEGDLYAETLVFVEPDSSTLAVIRTRADYDPETADEGLFGIGQYAAEASHFMPALRLGASLDTFAGRLVGGYAVPLEDGPSLDRNVSDRYSVGLLTSWKGRPRVSYSRRFDGSEAYAAGFQTGFCRSRFALGAGMVEGPERPRLFTVDISWSRGSGQCGAFRR